MGSFLVVVASPVRPTLPHLRPVPIVWAVQVQFSICRLHFVQQTFSFLHVPFLRRQKRVVNRFRNIRFRSGPFPRLSQVRPSRRFFLVLPPSLSRHLLLSPSFLCLPLPSNPLLRVLLVVAMRRGRRRRSGDDQLHVCTSSLNPSLNSSVRPSLNSRWTCRKRRTSHERHGRALDDTRPCDERWRRSEGGRKSRHVRVERGTRRFAGPRMGDAGTTPGRCRREESDACASDALVRLQWTTCVETCVHVLDVHVRPSPPSHPYRRCLSTPVQAVRRCPRHLFFASSRVFSSATTDVFLFAPCCSCCRSAIARCDVHARARHVVFLDVEGKGRRKGGVSGSIGRAIPFERDT